METELMGLVDNKCDNCEETIDILFPIGVKEPLPTGGSQMILRYYCVNCRDQIEEEASALESDKEKEAEEEEEERVYLCGCVFVRFDNTKPDNRLWSHDFTCLSHSGKDTIEFSCGCIVKQYAEEFYEYINVCEEHGKTKSNNKES